VNKVLRVKLITFVLIYAETDFVDLKLFVEFFFVLWMYFSII